MNCRKKDIPSAVLIVQVPETVKVIAITPRFYGEIEDTKVVLHWIKENIRPEKFMILGYSMGGIVTSVLCNEVPLDGILLWSPCSEPYENFRHLLGADLFDRGLKGEDVDFMGDLVCHEFFENLDAPQIDPLAAIKNFKKPLRLIQGDGDKDVLVYNSANYEKTVQAQSAM